MNYPSKVFRLRFYLRLMSLAVIFFFPISQSEAQRSRFKIIPKPTDVDKAIAVVDEGVTSDYTGLNITTAEAARVSINHLRKFGSLYKIKAAPETEYTFKGINPLYKFTTMQQQYQGYPILGSIIKVGINKNKEAYYSTGNYISINPKRFNFRRGVTENRAKYIVLNALTQEINEINLNTIDPKFLKSFLTTMEAKLVIYNRDFLTTGAPTDSNQLVWIIEVTLSPHQSYKYVVSALNGRIVTSMDNRQHSGPAPNYNKVCDYAYGCSCNLTSGRQGADPVRNLHPKYQNFDIDNSFNLFTSARTFYNTAFYRNGANNFSGTGDGLNVALTESRANANYTGCSASECTNGNAWYQDGQITFCAGSVSPDVMGHEYFHAFIDSIESTVFLPNSQSAAIHEGIADFFGEAFEFYATVGNQYDGLVGTNSNLYGLRSLRNPDEAQYSAVGQPELKPYPNNYNSNNFYCGTHADYKYFNSTVISHALYKAAVGGQFQCCMINGIGLPKTASIIYYTLVNRMTAVTNFTEFYNAVESGCYEFINASTNKYGVQETHCVELLKSLQAAELDLPGGCNGNQPANNNLAATCAVYPDNNNYRYGDYNSSGLTEGNDFLVLQRYSGCQGVNVPGDGNDDGSVDAADYTVWRDNYGTPVPEASPASSPVPG